MNNTTTMALAEPDKIKILCEEMLAKSTLNHNRPIPEIKFFVDVDGLIKMEPIQVRLPLKEQPFRETEYNHGVKVVDLWLR